ncbi:anti-phage-associated DUF1156 domain-containing protein [Siccirubricoccus sp. G192]|uniref:anti-phage-associated DUF1156 domain-containing protein n=1 Tax=Siccirubricoccus sp. G192 TaxID=2849651 RepID=UPI0035C7B0BC
MGARLGTASRNLPDLVRELGIARYGHNPTVGDPFCGGGSIPFEAARIGCSAFASDLSPVAAMLTWGAFNIVGASAERREAIAQAQQLAARAVASELEQLKVETNERGDFPKAYLYCLEVVDPQSGWRVPLLPSRLISSRRRCVARLVPDHARKRFDILIEEGVSSRELAAAATGTLKDGHLVYQVSPIPGEPEREWRIPITRLRGDGEGGDGAQLARGNRLRAWEISDIAPREPEWVADAPPVVPGAPRGAWRGGDIWLERLYAIQWMDGREVRQGKSRPNTFFAVPDANDLSREHRVTRFVSDNLANWQAQGFVPDMRIEPGEKTDEPIRTRGWTYWHHLFASRQLLFLALVQKQVKQLDEPALALGLARMADWSTRLCRYGTGASRESIAQTFYNQALNTLYAYGVRPFHFAQEYLLEPFSACPMAGDGRVEMGSAAETPYRCDLWIYDPPYADAVVYHEISEFFIAWLRRNAPAPFDRWTWDSRRPLAIQGKGDKFRADMVAAFRAMATSMPDNGLQVCMFTHKDAGVWADLAQIVWGAGLQVTAAWYVSTETTSELKQGGYVQGTVLMVLRKRVGDEHGFRSDIVPEVRDRVAKQVATLTGLNQKAHGRGRDENVFSDADIQMAGYAAALEVLTAYTHIDGTDMTREALRPREGKRTTEVGIVEEMITLAVQTANELMVPDGIAEGMWERFSPEERFYLKMTATEATWPAGQLGGKLDDYQNFARVYRATDWEDLMAERSPNKARLKGAAEFKRALMTGHPFAAGTIRPTLYAIAEQWRATAQDEDPRTSGDRILHGLRDHFGLENWRQARDNVRALAAWFGTVWERQRAEEAAAARVVAGLIASERLAG